MPYSLLEALISALDHFEAGFLALTPYGVILHANLAAREMMEAAWPIQSRDGSLVGCDGKTTAILLEGLRQAATLGQRSVSGETCLDICLADAASSNGVALATLKPLTTAALHPPPIALFVTCLPNPTALSLSGIVECFGLTPAEARALQHFSEGATVSEAALALTLSENTVKTHLQNVFAKTRVSRQSHLIRFINDFRPPLRGVAHDPAAGPMPQKDTISPAD